MGEADIRDADMMQSEMEKKNQIQTLSNENEISNDSSIDNKIKEMSIVIEKKDIEKTIEEKKVVAIKTYRPVGRVTLKKDGNAYSCETKKFVTNLDEARKQCCKSKFPAIKFGRALDLGKGQAQCQFVCQKNAISYDLVGKETIPAEIRKKIDDAMSKAVKVYSCYTNLTARVPVRYDPAVPTANATYFGRIAFGGSISYSTALHELGHFFGIGTSRKWKALVRDGKYHGPKANKLFQNIEKKPNAKINADGVHFWPHGMNYPIELTG